MMRRSTASKPLRRYGSAACILLLLAGTGDLSAAPAAPAPVIRAPNCEGAKGNLLPVNMKGMVGGYAVDGKKGKMICQFAKRKKDPNAAVDMEKTMAFDAQNRGEFQDRQLDMPQTTQKLEAMVERISQAWPYARPEHVRVQIVGSNVYGAEALPDNTLKVHLNLLNMATTDEEVAFILAHEYAHLVLGHLMRNKSIQGQSKLVSTMSNMYFGAVNLSQQEWVRTGSRLSMTPKDAAKIEAAQNDAQRANQHLHLALDVFITPAWKRSQEDEADALGYDLALASGYLAGSGSADAMDKMAEIEAQQAQFVDKLQADLEASLKSSADQLKAAQQSSGQALNEDVTFLDMWKGVQSTFRKRAVETFKSLFNSSHRSAVDRQAGLHKYYGLAYGEEDGAAAANSETSVIQSIQASDEFKQAWAATKAVDDSMRAREAGDLPLAATSMAAAMKTKFNTSPMVLNEQARLYVDLGKYNEADATFTKAHKSPLQSVEAYQTHVQFLRKIQKWDRAQAVTTEAIGRYKDEKPFLPGLIAINLGLRQEDKAVTYLTQCIATEDPNLKVLCVASTPDPTSPEFQALGKPMQDAVWAARGQINNKSFIASTGTAFSGVFDGIAGLFKSE